MNSLYKKRRNFLKLEHKTSYGQGTAGSHCAHKCDLGNIKYFFSNYTRGLHVISLIIKRENDTKERKVTNPCRAPPWV